MKNPNSIKKIKIPIPILIIGFLGLMCLGIFVWMVKNVEAAKQEYYSAREMLQLYRNEIWHLQNIDREKLDHRLQEELKRFPSANEITDVADQISEFGKLSGVKLSLISPKEPQAANSDDPVTAMFLHVPIDVQLSGSYENIAHFLSSLKMLSKGVLTVDHFEMTPTVAGKSDISLALTLNAYVKKTSDQQILTEKSIAVSTVHEPSKSRASTIQRNPFLQADEKSGFAVSVEGIIYDPKNPMVLIAGDVKRLGDQVDGLTIVEIRRDAVILAVNDKSGRKIELKPGLRR